MSRSENFSSSDLLKAETLLWNHVSNSVSSSLVKCAIELDIFDVLFEHGNPMSLSDLSTQISLIHSSKHAFLPSLMRFLVHANFLNEHESYCYFSLKSAGRLLVKNEPLNIRSQIFLNNDPSIQKLWCELGKWFQDDLATPFYTAHGKSLWDYIHDAEKQEAAARQLGDIFNDSMVSDSRFMTNVVIPECKDVFSGLMSLVDVGGGTGTMAIAIAKAFPTMRCVVLDLPSVIGDLKGIKSENNLEFVGGSMFDEIPHANAILLKYVLHDWNDQECVKILKKCKESIPSRDKGGKLIIIDVVMEEELIRDEIDRAKDMMNLTMMVVFAAKERTKKEWEKLYYEAGFSEYKITHSLGLRSLIQVYP